MLKELKETLTVVKLSDNHLVKHKCIKIKIGKRQNTIHIHLLQLHKN